MTTRERWCFEPCNREESELMDGDLRFNWVRVQSGEVYQWLDRDEELPEGVIFVRPVTTGEGSL